MSGGVHLLREYAPPLWSPPDEYTEQCARFSHEVLGIKLWYKQLELVESFFANPRTACRSGHSTGKSATASVVFEYCLSVLGYCVWTTAPSMEQVHKLWKEVSIHRASATRMLPGEIVAGGPSTAPRLKTCDPGLWAKGFSTNRAERAQGLHVVNLVIVVDEGAGVAKHVWLAIESSMASAGVRILVLGNPTNERGRFWQIFWDDQIKTRWVQHHISSIDSPNINDAEREYFNTVILPAFRSGRFDIRELEKNLPPADEPVIPGLASMNWILDQIVNYKDEPNIFDNRVLGDNADDDSQTKTIPAYYIDAAMELWLQLEEEEEGYLTPPKIHCAFLDVAGQGNDRCSLAFLRGQRFHVAKWWFDRSDEGLMNIADDTNAWVINLPGDQKPLWLAVDIDAVGAGVYANLVRLRRQHKEAWGRCRLLKFHWGWSASDDRKDEFERIISEVYWDLRKALDPSKPYNERLAIPPGVSHLKPDPLPRKELFEQLNARNYEYDIRERVIVESKQVLRNRIGVSPDVADSIAGCMFKPRIVRAASA